MKRNTQNKTAQSLPFVPSRIQNPSDGSTLESVVLHTHSSPSYSPHSSSPIKKTGGGGGLFPVKLWDWDLQGGAGANGIQPLGQWVGNAVLGYKPIVESAAATTTTTTTVSLVTWHLLGKPSGQPPPSSPIIN